MRLTRFAAGSTGRSEFSQIEIDYPTRFEGDGGYGLLASLAMESPGVQFIVLPAGYDEEPHPVPQRQLVFVLGGELEVGTPDGQTRRFVGGEMFLADDMGTDGHTTRTVGGAARLVFIPIPSTSFFHTVS